jgi:hypothetical protein
MLEAELGWSIGAEFRRFPVRRLSTQITWCPSPRNRSQRCDPMNPAPPVITVLNSGPPLCWVSIAHRSSGITGGRRPPDAGS